MGPCPPSHRAARAARARFERADISGGPAGAIRRAGQNTCRCFASPGQPISPGLWESAQCPRYQVGRGAVETADPSPASSAERAGEPRWDWGTRFLWSATIIIRKEVVGELPDGLRINWNVVEGSFAGPGHEGIVLPGATDLMRIRKDGIGVVNVTEVLQTRRGARLYCSWRHL